MENASQRRKVTLKITNKKYDEFVGLPIIFKGFSRVPHGFSEGGFIGGKQLLKQFRIKCGDFKLIITKREKSRLARVKGTRAAKIYLNYDDYMYIRGKCIGLRKLTDRKTIIQQLPKIFPGNFKLAGKAIDEITLPREVGETDFSRNELRQFRRLAPTLAQYGIYQEEDLKKLVAARPVLHYLQLERILREFRSGLKLFEFEHDWQEFFKKSLLVLNPGYVACIDNLNVAISVRLPDFVLVNLHDYIDVYEIKLPKTELLRYDRNHKNYYWTAEMSIAISQVENYLDELNKQASAIRNHLEDDRGIKARVIRPRGYVIAGTNKQIDQKVKKKDNFRILCESLRNTEIVPYDSFLERFKAFSDILKTMGS